jgi:PadR family transcriptional regulator PadR
MKSGSPESRNPLASALEMMIRQLLQHQRSHGYAFVQDIKRTSQDLLQVEEGSVYPAFQRMLKAGSAKPRWEASTSGRRVRTHERTARGTKHVDWEISNLEQMLTGIRLARASVQS